MQIVRTAWTGPSRGRPWTAGNNRAIRTPMIVMTTKSSTRVNAASGCLVRISTTETRRTNPLFFDYI